jgi:hypothetical protein
MKTHFFTHPQASTLAEQDAKIANDLVRGKSVAIRHNGKGIHIAEFKSYTMHSQEASRFELIDNEGSKKERPSFKTWCKQYYEYQKIM